VHGFARFVSAAEPIPKFFQVQEDEGVPFQLLPHRAYPYYLPFYVVYTYKQRMILRLD